MPTAPVIEKLLFKSPSDMIEKLEVEHKLPLVVNALLGTWHNVDHNTRGLKEIIIAAAGTEITVHCFGACEPKPCDWSSTAGLTYAANVNSTPAIAFSAKYTFPFKDTIVTGRMEGMHLVVETFDHFKDNSHRSNYFSTYRMQK